MREEDDATMPASSPTVGAQGTVTPGPEANAPPEQSSAAQAQPHGHPDPAQHVPWPHGAPPPPAQSQQHAQQPAFEHAFMMQFAQMFVQSMQQSNQRMEQMLGRQTAFMQHVLATNAQSQRRSHQKKGNPPTFDAKPSEDPDGWLYATEKFYSPDCADIMQANTSEFTTMVFCNLGPVAQSFYHELETSMTSTDCTVQPITWAMFKDKFREGFREKDFEFKLLTKLYMLRPTSTQQEYTTRFQYLLSQLPPIPEFIKRWLYQQNIRSETSAFISQNVPHTLSEVIELAHRFEDSRRAQPVQQGNNQGKGKGKNSSGVGEKRSDGNGTKPSAERWCAFCSVATHNTADCRKKKAAEAAAASGKREGSPKNG
jgi:hypothetical protein